TRAALIASGLACGMVGPYAVAHSNTEGLHRNPMVAFARSLLPRVPARAMGRDWRESPSQHERVPADLSLYRGSATSRNVVLISLESTAAQYLKPWGGSNDPMPNLSRLAGAAILIENAYAVYPESIKGLFSTLCSTYPAIDTSVEVHAASRIPSLAHVLAQHGYTNALFHSGRFMYLGMDDVIENRGFNFLCDAGGISGNVNSSFGVDEPATIEKMLRWIDSVPRNRRFFLCYLPIAGRSEE